MVTDFLRNVVGEFRCRAFDWRHGVRTCGNASLSELTLVGNNSKYGVHYHPSHPKFLFESFASLDIHFEDFTFIDFGSGKGRVLLVASEFPFRKIVGVEFASELHGVATHNVRNYRSSTQKCKNIETINGDAADFSFPPTPLVIYMFNPFGPVVLKSVLKNLRESLESKPREVILSYLAPFHGDLVVAETPLKYIVEDAYHKVYRFQPKVTEVQ